MSFTSAAAGLKKYSSLPPYRLKRYKSLFSGHHSRAVRRFQNNHSTLNLSIKNLSHSPGRSLAAKPSGSFPKTQRNGRCKCAAGKGRQAEAQTASCKHTRAHASKKLPADSHPHANFLRSCVQVYQDGKETCRETKCIYYV